MLSARGVRAIAAADREEGARGKGAARKGFVEVRQLGGKRVWRGAHQHARAEPRVERAHVELGLLREGGEPL